MRRRRSLANAPRHVCDFTRLYRSEEITKTPRAIIAHRASSHRRSLLYCMCVFVPFVYISELIASSTPANATIIVCSHGSNQVQTMATQHNNAAQDNAHGAYTHTHTIRPVTSAQRGVDIYQRVSYLIEAKRDQVVFVLQSVRACVRVLNAVAFIVTKSANSPGYT